MLENPLPCHRVVQFASHHSTPSSDTVWSKNKYHLTMVFYQYMYQHCDWEYWIYLTQVKGFKGPNQGHMPGGSRCSLNASLFKILRNQQWLQTRHKWPQPFSPCQKNLLSSIQSGVSWGCGSQLGKLPINFTDLVMLSLSILCIWMYWIYPTLKLTVRCGKSTICRSCSERATAATIDVPHLFVCLP